MVHGRHTGDLSSFDFQFSFQGYGKHISDVPEKCAEFLRCVQGHLCQYDPALDFSDKPVYTLYAEELIRIDRAEDRRADLGGRCPQREIGPEVEISKEMTEEAESARGREKAAGNKLGMLRDQLEHERNEKDAEILLLKGENEKLKAAGTDFVQRIVQTMISKALKVNRLDSLINQVNYSLELYAGLKADGIAVPKEKIEKLLADLKRLNEEFDAFDVEVAKPEDYLVIPVANGTRLHLSSFELDFGEESRARPSREVTPAAEDVEVPQDGEDAQGERRQGGEVCAVDASTNEELDSLFPSSKND
ncbi:hypothetical protein AALP_AAs45078U000900 [Arabis alpina]|uniref:Uncharacterized protein n=1 Tax=Arabis alpina TaxID=50452 RepID=A0A087G3X7_ARAAL|nr:hypothetical protein AALP_AAs45078U000900 [Arabis alpina]